ncbi:hypothetical protein [Collinsella ihumii]|uniref:hypothetical protein n=1 Tax=Collinsella ihumii TaxID=1720204 RepID=UPI0025AAA6E8|nr:hypothetical protein [Collinsella ihumii]MDN0055808.1 hypothetical protein [Collinsella ihumii]
MANMRARKSITSLLHRLAAGMAVMLACAMLLAAPVRALAAVYGSIVLDCRVTQDGRTVVLAGDTWGIARVASVEIDAAAGVIVGYEPVEPFERFDYAWGDMSASQVDEAAKDLARYATENDLYTARRATDADGAVGFWNLEPGLYLVNRITAAPGNEGFTCDPFMVSIPLAEDGKLIYSITAAPKFEGPGEPGEPEDPDEPENPGEPENPEDPGDPDNPEEPGDPDEPGEPGEPEEPGDPDEPGEPGEPEKPGEPDEPGKPWNPDEFLTQTGDSSRIAIGALLVLGGAALITGRVLQKNNAQSKVAAPSSTEDDQADE